MASVCWLDPALQLLQIKKHSGICSTGPQNWPAQAFLYEEGWLRGRQSCPMHIQTSAGKGPALSLLDVGSQHPAGPGKPLRVRTSSVPRQHTAPAKRQCAYTTKTSSLSCKQYETFGVTSWDTQLMAPNVYDLFATALQTPDLPDQNQFNPKVLTLQTALAGSRIPLQERWLRGRHSSPMHIDRPVLQRQCSIHMYTSNFSHWAIWCRYTYTAIQKSCPHTAKCKTTVSHTYTYI